MAGPRQFRALPEGTVTGANERQQWVDAMWDDPDLTTHERLVALAFAKYAGKGLDCVWVEGRTLLRLTSMSQSQATRCIKSLIDKRWLKLLEKARQHYSPRYELRFPDHAQRALTRHAGSSRVPRGDARVLREDAQSALTGHRITRTTTTSARGRDSGARGAGYPDPHEYVNDGSDGLSCGQHGCGLPEANPVHVGASRRSA